MTIKKQRRDTGTYTPHGRDKAAERMHTEIARAVAAKTGMGFDEAQSLFSIQIGVHSPGDWTGYRVELVDPASGGWYAVGSAFRSAAEITAWIDGFLAMREAMYTVSRMGEGFDLDERGLSHWGD